MYQSDEPSRKRKLDAKWVAAVALIVVIIFGAVFYITRGAEPRTVEEKVEARLVFDESVTEAESTLINSEVAAQNIDITGQVDVSVSWEIGVDNEDIVLMSYVPTVDKYDISQDSAVYDLQSSTVSSTSDENISDYFEPFVTRIAGVDDSDGLSSTDSAITFIPFEDVSTSVKVISIEGNYFLDEFNGGAVHRVVSFDGEGSSSLAMFQIERMSEKDVFKTNITGVTALTREMQNKLDEVKDPLFFSDKIGDFLADADLTHVSNEVSFKEPCAYSRTLFCSPPEFIETLKASGVDLVELTGNHNNDLGDNFNTETINQYHDLGMGTVGGGLNAEEAAKPFTVSEDGTNLAFLAYNYPDSIGSGAIATETKAGANSFDFEKIEKDIAEAKVSSDSVIVNVQFWECYAYPDGYIEFPKCDKPIGEQEATFKKIVDLGADMVVGSSAHQPQTWEYYKGKPIYYGLGNMYFEQTQWPGTERGLVLSNYYVAGEHVQTKITPTVYGKDFQPRLMNDEEANYLLGRLNEAR